MFPPDHFDLQMLSVNCSQISLAIRAPTLWNSKPSLKLSSLRKPLAASDLFDNISVTLTHLIPSSKALCNFLQNSATQSRVIENTEQSLIRDLCDTNTCQDKKEAPEFPLFFPSECEKLLLVHLNLQT